MKEADGDLGFCDECLSTEGTRRRVPYHGVMAWLCGECRTRLAMLNALDARKAAS